MKNLLTKITFNIWYWFKKPPWDTNITPPELVQFVEENPPGRVLDLGCGTGTNVIALARRGWRATGVDFAPRAIQLAKKKALAAGLESDFYVSDVTKIDGIHGPFDLILDIGCFHSIPDERRSVYLSQINRLLKPGGTFLLYAFFRTTPDDSNPGITESQIESFSPPLYLSHREDGTNRGDRPSAWMWFTKELK